MLKKKSLILFVVARWVVHLALWYPTYGLVLDLVESEKLIYEKIKSVLDSVQKVFWSDVLFEGIFLEKIDLWDRPRSFSIFENDTSYVLKHLEPLLLTWHFGTIPRDLVLIK